MKKYKVKLTRKAVNNIKEYMLNPVAWPFPTVCPNNLDVPLLKNEDKGRVVKYVHIRSRKGYSYTVAYRNCVEGRHSKFIEVAVAVCSPEDQFNRSIGRNLATARLDKGNYIVIPFRRECYKSVDELLNVFFGVIV